MRPQLPKKEPNAVCGGRELWVQWDLTDINTNSLWVQWDLTDINTNPRARIELRQRRPRRSQCL